ncbi:MAG: M48 family metallopeptidase [Betaproteobacteria bacterium]
MNTFTIVFAIALAAATATRLWLAWRHVRYIQAHRDQVPDSFSAQIDLPAHQRAADYSSAKTGLNAFGIVVDAALLLIFTLGGGFAALNSWAHVWFGSGLAGGVALIAAVMIVSAAVELPLNVYRVFGIETRFGFNKMSPMMFVTDLAKQAAVAALLGLPLVLAVLWMMGRMGEYWWFWVWLVWMGFNLFVLAFYPTFIAPLFNKFSPMQDGELKARIEALLVKCGFRSQGLFVMDGSRRSSHGNAYFTGFGKAKRIVFFDTLLTRLEPGEIEAVLAHELGHFKMNHVVRRMAWTFAVSLAFLWVLGQLRDAAWFFEGLGVGVPAGDAMALVLFFTIVPVFTFLLRPLLAMYSRKHEFEADAYAARYTPASELAQALVKLYKDNATTLTPDPLHSAFYDSHPPAAARIAKLKLLAGT